jgi:hypothetical protein
MNAAVQVEAHSLIEKMSDDDMPAIAAVILEAWCSRCGATRESIVAFMGRMIQAQDQDHTRHVLTDIAEKYEAGMMLED